MQFYLNGYTLGNLDVLKERRTKATFCSFRAKVGTWCGSTLTSA